MYASAVKKQTITEEKDILIDHGFDGIMELDNQLPKWWLGLFWFGIAYCVVYMISFWTTDFAHQDIEYSEEYKAQTASIAEYVKNTPAPTIENAAYSSDNIAAGEEVFKTNCVSCHSANGVITGFDIQNVAAYIYHINQEQPPITVAEGGAAPQGTPANWEK